MVWFHFSELKQVLQAANGLDLSQVNEGLDSLALTEVEAERFAALGSVLVRKPERE
jgi:hypothetical protein